MKNNDNKVGILSIHAAHNYGSVLQAYALQETIKKISDDVEIIDYRPDYFEMMYKLFSFRIYKKFPGIVNKIVHLGWRTIMLPRRLKKIAKFNKFIRKNQVLSNRKYRNEGQLRELSDAYNIVFVGSDQVWNTDITEGFDGAFYLDFLSKKTIKASYAASIARKEIDNRYIDQYKKSLSRFDYISVREETGRKQLKKIISNDVEVNIDPTLLLDRDEWDKIAKQSKMKINGEYIFTYILQDNPNLVQIVNKISEELNLPIVSIGKKKRFKKEKIYPDAGPEDFLYLIKKSTFVVTNSFHGTVFSIIYEKNNCVIPHLETGSRVVDLMKKIGIEDRIARNADDIDSEKILADVDYSHAYNIIAKERLSSTRYMRKAISDERKK